MQSLYQTLSRVNQIHNVFNNWSLKLESNREVSTPKPTDEILATESSENLSFTDYLLQNGVASPYNSLIKEASQKYELPDSLISSVIQVESNFNKDAVSPKGAMGLMQLMPDTANQYKVKEPYSPQDNIDAGAKHLRNLLDRYDGNLIQALAAYNAGGSSIKYNSIPSYQETQNYVKKVIKNYMKYNGVEL